ncbi:hypothetical protein CRM22_000419 [Opisthorchis felineus]|uniref:TIL domain-containing protein n=1 Tax=Opisthorchis felineus TaxID=147828 RepID=A0A4S2MF93_OPIFE|nr:hypothetical protein CRM22_000419 [Opisthorchis felineus]
MQVLSVRRIGVLVTSILILENMLGITAELSKYGRCVEYERRKQEGLPARCRGDCERWTREACLQDCVLVSYSSCRQYCAGNPACNERCQLLGLCRCLSWGCEHGSDCANECSVSYDHIGDPQEQMCML